METDARYAVLLHERRRKVSPTDGLPLRLVVIDELAFYLSIGERKEIAAFATGLRDLVSRGRAAGIIVVAATQEPAHDIVPTGVRDLFAFRWALRGAIQRAAVRRRVGVVAGEPAGSGPVVGAGCGARD